MHSLGGRSSDRALATQTARATAPMIVAFVIWVTVRMVEVDRET